MGVQGKRYFSCVFSIAQVLFGPSGKESKRAAKMARRQRFEIAAFWDATLTHN